MPSVIYVLLAVCIGLVCGAGSGYLARAREQGATKTRLWIVWALAITVVLACAAGMGTINATARPPEALKFFSVVTLIAAFLGGLMYFCRKG